MSQEKNIAVLTEISRSLVDSCLGYGLCQDVVKDSRYFQKEFAKRQNDRQKLLHEFKSAITDLGGDDELSGSIPGAIHRAYTKFTKIFKTDKKAAIDALDTGEEFLAEHIESQLEVEGLTAQTLELLQKAHEAAISGEKFADRFSDSH